MVGAKGFEPSTLWSQTRCATRLRYAPTYWYCNGSCGSVPSDTLCQCHFNLHRFHGLHRARTSPRQVRPGVKIHTHQDCLPQVAIWMLTPYAAPTARAFFPGSAKGRPSCGGAPIPEWCLTSPNSAYTLHSKKHSRNSAKQRAVKFASTRLLSKSFKPVQQVPARARRAHGYRLT